ncbi:TIGR01777 family oxidoreductase [Thermodesulfobacteriota bacterium]
MTGGSGFVGSFLAKKLTEKGHEVNILTRKIKLGRILPDGATFTEGDPTKPGPWQEKVADYEAVINLAGAPLFKRWTKEYKKKIHDSRIPTTKNLVDALKSREGQQTHFLNTSAVGYYGYHDDEALYEDSKPGEDFLANLAYSWESAALRAKEYGARVVLCRFGIVLGKNGGTLAQLIPIFKWYLGAPLGNGKQWFSWIHEQDLASIFSFLLEHKELEGPVNCTAPYPVRNKEMTKILGDVLQKPTFLPPVPGFVLKLIKGEFATVLVKGQKVIPKKLADSGYHFEFPSLKEALENTLK